MNKNIYRIIFNKKRGMMMAVAETANSRGKDCGGGGSTVLSIWALMRLNRLAISIAALFGSVAIVHAQIVADPNATGNKRPFVDVSANGRPLVQITTPNAAGVSHNLYNQFNVDSGGTILNNAKSVVSTQLGGYVGANPNLANGSARIILNEVTGPSVSQLRGYTEVAGQRAEVVIANPNGISCDGCGFINTSRGLLTTGTPVFGGDGSLDAFRVTKGQIQIGPNGLNSSNVDQLDLIARSVAVNGELWANRLNVIAGPNLVSYADLGVQVIQGEGNTPTVGIDVAQLGGMYANKIRLIGTEAGVGVNSLGNIAAQAGDLMIDSQGRISLSGKTTASNGLVVTGNGGLSNSGTLYGQQDVSISTQGAISNSGTVAAQGDLSVSGTTIKSTGILGAGIDANGGASYARNLQVSASGSVTASGQNAAGGDITLTGTRVDMAGAQTRAGGNATLNATAGDIDHVAGNLQAGGEVHLQAAGAINNDGGTLGATQINSSSASLSNKAGSLIQAGNGDTTIVTTGAIDNSGGTISTNGSRLNIQSTELSNIHGQINHAGTGVLSVHTGSVNNTDGSIGTNGALEVTASGLNNLCGGLYAAGRAIITATSDLTNTQGSIQAGAALAVTAANVDNSAGRMVSINVDGLTLSSSGQLTNALGTTAAGSEGGVIGSNGDVTVSAAGLSNSGSITAAGSLNATVGGALSNDNGKLVAGNDLRVAATGLSNTSGVVDAAKVNLIIPQLDNSGGKISADQLTMTATNLTNQSGLIAQYGTQATTLAVSDTLDNSNGGLIQTNSTDLSLTPQFLNNDGGTIAHAGAGRLTINAGSGTGSVSNRSGSISSNGQVDVAGASVNNQAGAVYGQNEVGITATQGDVTNRGGGYLGGNILTITANSGQVDNTDGLIEAANGVIIQTRSLSNAGGKVQNTGAAALIVSASQDITNTVAGGSGGFIGGAGTVHVAAATVNNAGGTIYGADNLTLFSNGLLTNTGGAIQGEADLSVAAGGPLRNDSGRIDASGVSSILTVSGSSIDNTAGRIVNSGSGQTQVNGGSQISNSNATGTAGMGIIGGNGNVSITTATLRNNQNGQVIAAGDLVLNVGDAVNNNSGSSLKASGNLALTASNLDNTNGQIGTLAHSGSNVVIAASNSVANAGGTIGADHDLRLSTNTLGAAGQISAGHDATFNLGSGYTVAAGVTLQANNDLTFNAAGNLSNAGTIQAVNKLTINAAGITNQSGGMLNSGDTNLVASNGYGDISNAGNISGDIVTTSSNRFDNTAAVIGENITLNANAITNQGLAAVIAASNKINLFARNSLLNADGATIYSLGGLNIAADNAQDAFGNYLHRSQQVTNSSATIETDGDLTVSADNIINKRTTLQIQRDIYDGAVSWSKYNYYWRSWGPGMTGPDTAGLMAPVTKTLPFNDSTAFGSQYGSILQVDSANNRALIQFQGNNQLWVYYKSIKKNAGNSYDMTFYEGKFCPGYGELCPYQQMVWREYSGSLVLDQFDPSRYTSPAELDRIGINGESAYDFRERSFNGSTYHDELIAASAASKMSASGKITISTGALLNDASNITAGGTIAINGTTDGSSGVVTNRGYSINKTEIGVTVDHYDRHVGNHSYATFNDTIVSALSTIDANIQSNQGVVINAPTINNTTVNAAQPAVSGSSLGTSQNNGVSASGKPRSTAAASGSAGDGASFQGNVQTVGSANVPLPDLTLPQNGLFSIHHGPEQHYLVETDPRFTNYRNFLGSDYMLSRLVMDPTAIQKRLGDGFYEQKLINDQVAGLTGKRFLDGYASAEDEFRSLMNNGVAAASQFKLTPGIALSKEQMAALTSDIVWMVEQEVSVPGGGRERVLVPVVYLTQAHQAELKPSGALIGGQNVALSGDTVTNSGIIRAQESVVARANVLDNIGGEIRGDSVDLVGRQHLMVGTDFQAAGRQGSVKGREVSLQGGDITIAGAKVAAAEALTMMADNNLTIGSATAQRSASFAWGKTGNLAENHGIMRDGGVAANWTQVQGSSVESGGSLVAAAGRDIRIKGSKVAAEGQATLVASGQVDIGADKNITASHVTGRSDSYYLDAKGYNETVVGSSVEGAQGLTVVAQGKNGSSGDVNISASTLSSREGSTIVAAAGSLTIGSDTRRRSNDLYEAGGDARIKTDEKSVEGIGSAIGGEKGVTLVAQGTSNAGRLDIIGSNVSSNGRIDVIAKDNVTIAESRTSTDYERTAHDESSGFLSHSSSDSHDRVVQNIANGSTISGDQVNILSGKSITVQGSNVVGTQDVTFNAKDNVTITTAQSTSEESHYKHESKSGLMGGGGIGFTIGSRKQEGQGDFASVTNTSSTVGSVSGNVSIQAGDTYQQVGSNVLALQGNIDVAAQKVSILEAHNTEQNAQQTKFSQSGISVSLTNPVISALQTGMQMKEAASQTKDKRMQALAGAATALAAKNAYDAVSQNPGQAGGINVSVSLGSSRSESNGSQTSSTAVGSTVAAGGNVNIIAMGAGKDSDITIQGSNVKAGNNAALIADGDINLLAAKSTAEQHGSNHSSSASIGVSLGTNTGIFVSGSKGRGNEDGADVTWTNTHIDAGNKLILDSGGDMNLKGAVATGKQVVANVGGDLNIESLQDVSKFDSKQQNVGGSITVGPGMVSGSVNFSKSKINSDFASVTEQSGIKAGDGGFQVNVKGNTDLTGAVIASTDKAVQEGKNNLSTATLTYKDIQNKAEYEGESIGIGVGYSTNGTGVGKDQQGKAETGGKQTPGTGLPSLNGFSAALPMVASASGSTSSTTVSGISAGAISIIDEGKQKELTGKDAATTVASINREVSSDKDTSNALKPIFNEQEIKAGFTIVEALNREVGTFIVNRAKEIDQTRQAAKEKDAQADLKELQAQALPDGDEKNRLLQEVQVDRADAVSARLEAKDLEEKWGPGGGYRQVMSAATAAAGGNVTGGASEFVQSTVVNWVQSKATEEIKQLADELGIPEGSPAHAALHAINACVGAAAQSSNCGAAALGAASASVVGALLADSQGSAEKLTNEQKEARQTLVTTLVTGVAAITGNATAANTAALIEMENNSNVKNAVKAAINDAKDYLGSKAKQGGEKLAGLLEKLEIKSLVEKRDAIARYLDEAAARGGLSEEEIAALGIIYAANAALFPTSVLDLPVTKAIGGAGRLIKNGVRAEEAVKIASADVRALDSAKKTIQTANAEAFERSLVRLPPGERVATVKQAAKNVAESNGWEKDARLSRINDRDVYKAPDGYLYSLDTQHGAWEKINPKTGAHEGQVRLMDLAPQKTADLSGGHDLRVK